MNSNTSNSTRPPAPRPLVQMGMGCFVIPLLVVILISGTFFYMRVNASTNLVVPDQDVILVRTMPDDDAPLLARFGAGRSLTITGRSADWRWLEVEVWAGQRGWTRRPLDILVWQLDAEQIDPQQASEPADAPTLIVEEMVEIPATTFTMGSPAGLGDVDESPPHAVEISAFAIDKYEVTIGHYWACVIDDACAPPTDDASVSQPHYFNDPAFNNHPVVNVSWVEANNYCLWRGKRLPTEAEWELAAGWDFSNGAKMLWVWGSDSTQTYGNLGQNSTGDTAIVGTFSSDIAASGALDMAGNVSEWVFDWYKVDYYDSADSTDPIGPSHRRGEGSGRVVRGGSFADSITEARTTNRRHQAETYGYPTVGFRCVQDLD